jgi:hypothetical protein
MLKQPTQIFQLFHCQQTWSRESKNAPRNLPTGVEESMVNTPLGSHFRDTGCTCFVIFEPQPTSREI